MTDEMSVDFKSRLQKLMEKVEQDGALDQQEVKLIKDEIVRDRVVSHEEAALLFKLENMTREERASDDFSSMFVNGITSYLLYTGETQGRLDDKEWIWLQDRISENHSYSLLERTLLQNLVYKAEDLPENFYDWVNDMETHYRDFKDDKDPKVFEVGTSFVNELKAILKRFQ